MNIILYKIYRFFELHIGWFFVNGHKREHWNNYLREKYKDDFNT